MKENSNMFGHFKSISLIFFLFQSFTNTANAEKFNNYSKCIKSFDEINNTIVAGCASEATEHLKLEIYDVINELKETKLKQDFEMFTQAHSHWLKYMSLSCQLDTLYIGGLMEYYCPMIMLEKKLNELETKLQEMRE